MTTSLAVCALLAVNDAQGEILDGDQHAARFTSANTVFYDDDAPILQTREILGGFEIVGGPDFEDEISYTSSITEVLVTIKPPSGESITVTKLSGPTWTEDTLGNWEATFTVPAAGEETSGSFDVALGGSPLSSGGAFKIKKMTNPD